MRRAIILVSLLALGACAAPPPPPPPAPPAAAVAPNRVFTVYFDWNRSWLGPQARAILQQAATTYHAGGVVTVQITGYADASGSPAFNQRLSMRRAWHVAGILEHDGVPRSALRIAGRGENDLAVPTPAGMREPRNRRVTV